MKQKESFDENGIVSHLHESGYFERDTVRDKKGRAKTITKRVTENPDKIMLDSVLLHGFKLELFYYKDKPDILWLGTGEKITIIQDYEVKSLFRLFMKAGNRIGMMGNYCNKNMKKRFFELKNKKEGNVPCNVEKRGDFKG